MTIFKFFMLRPTHRVSTVEVVKLLVDLHGIGSSWMISSVFPCRVMALLESHVRCDILLGGLNFKDNLLDYDAWSM